MKKILTNYAFLTFFLVLALSVISCKKDEPDPLPEDTSQITSLTLQLDTNQKGHQDATASVQDAAGINGKAGSTVTVDANDSYTGTLVLLDATQTPTATVTSDYTVTYQLTGVDASISASGSSPTLTTRTAGSGTLGITMVKGDKTTTVTFPITIR